MFWQAAGPKRKSYVLGALALLVVDILDLAPPVVMGWLVDTVSGTDRRFSPGVLALGFMGVILFQNVFRYPMRRYFIGTGCQVVAWLRARFVAGLLHSAPEFYRRQATGDLVSRGSSDVEAVERAMGFGLLILIDTAYYLLTIPVVMLFISPILTLYSFALLPIVPFLVYKMSRFVERKSAKVQELMGRLTSLAQENAAGAQHIRAWGAQEAQIAKFRMGSEEYVAERLSLSRWEAATWPMFHFLLVVGVFAVLWFGGSMTLSGELSIGQIVTFVQYMYMLVWPLMALGWVVSIFQRAKASLGRIDQVIRAAGSADSPAAADASVVNEAPARGDEISAAAKQDGKPPAIEIRKLTFRYPNADRPALENLSLQVRPGEIVALVGPVGSGKSTLVELLTRMSEPPPGSIFLAGKDVCDYGLADLRRRFSVSSRDSDLFARTIRENIALGRQEPSSPNNPEIELAAREACVIHDTFAHALDVLLGERGVNLSGGQKQRVALARAFLRVWAPVLILDDALSAVDAQTEEQIASSIQERSARGQAILIITHRARTAKLLAHRIIVLDAGKMADQGTHEELLARKNEIYGLLLILLRNMVYA